MVSNPLKSYLFWSRTLCSLLVLRRFNCVLIVMLFILVRSSMKMEKSSNRVAEDAFFDEKTYIDSSHGKGTDFSKAITDRLEFLTEVKSHSLMSTWSTVPSSSFCSTGHTARFGLLSCYSKYCWCDYCVDPTW